MNNHKLNFLINLTHGMMILLFILALTSCSARMEIDGKTVERKNLDKKLANCTRYYYSSGHLAYDKCTDNNTVCYVVSRGISCVKQ